MANSDEPEMPDPKHHAPGGFVDDNSATASGRRVLLVVMPWADVHNGSLGVSTLKAILVGAGIAADVRYLNVPLAARLGLKTYGLISQLTGGGGFGGEILFSPYYFKRPLPEFVADELATYSRGIFGQLREMGISNHYESVESAHAAISEIVRDEIPRYLADCLEMVRWEKYDIVGFSLMFDQTLASLCLARALKSRFPRVLVVFGGATCDGDMGAEIARCFDCVDVVVRGEADEVIVQLITALRGGGELTACPGVVFRRDGALIETAPASPVRRMDALPIPNYEDFVSAVSELKDFEPRLYFESSRGCWWGQKTLCSFCGLNATGLEYRRKSAERVLDELLSLERRHGIRSFIAADNIIDLGYFTSLLPLLADLNRARPPDQRISLFFETKSNLRKWQIELLPQAGITSLQPGIESFSDHVLALMRKGCSAIQQIQFIKWATESRVQLVYGILYRNPGETAEDYEEMLDMIRFLRHLPPPLYVIPISLDRFSPYFRDPQAHGMRRVRAHESYRRLFPSPHIDHDRLAYKFSFDHDDHAAPRLQGAIARCVDALLAWRCEFRPDTLVFWHERDNIIIRDSRPGKETVGTLRGAQAAIFSNCDEYRSANIVREAFPQLPPMKISKFLDELVDREWMYRDRRGRYITLPVHRPRRAQDPFPVHAARQQLGGSR